MGIDFEPIGKVKLSRSQRWQKKAKDLKELLKVFSISMFILGMTCGVFIGIYI